MFTWAVVMVSLSAGLLITFLGIPVLAAGLVGCRAFGALERKRARALLGVDVPAPQPVRGKRGMAWIGAVLKSGVSWRHLLYSVLHFPWALFSFVVSLSLWVYGWGLVTYPLWQWVFPTYTGQDGIQLYGDGTHDFYLDSPFEITLTVLVGLVVTLAVPWIIRGFAYVDRGLLFGLLGPSRLEERVVELESDRGVVVDTSAADLRRIERDLHDGAQARLVALAMDLGLAKEKLTEDPQAAARMVDSAHGEVKVALQELRDLARGIHPAVLTDRGLDAALSSVASRCTVPVQVEVDLPGRPVPHDRGDRVLHRLRAAAEREQAQWGEPGRGGCVAGSGPADVAGHGQRAGWGVGGRGIRACGARGAAGCGGRDSGGGFASGWAYDGDGGAAVAGVSCPSPPLP